MNARNALNTFHDANIDLILRVYLGLFFIISVGCKVGDLDRIIA